MFIESILNVPQKITRSINKFDPTFALLAILVLLIFSLFNGFLSNHIIMLTLAKSKKHSSHDSFIPIKTSVKTKKGHHNNSPIDSKDTSNGEAINSRFNTNTDNKTAKIVILTFGDTKKSQFTIAKPILDQYGFKASFFITCSYANDRDPRYHLNWNQILALQQDGQDIESKGMTPN